MGTIPNKSFNFLHDCKSVKIAVPCGICPSCVALRQNYFVQRCQMEELDNHLFMATFTYNRKMIPSREVNGRRLYYFDFSDFQKMIKRVRHYLPSFRYIVVSEYGGSNHRPHAHALFSFPKDVAPTYCEVINLESHLHDVFLREWSRNLGSKRKPIYEPLCTYVNNHKGRTFDFHYVNPSSTPAGESDVAFYVSKYILKTDSYVQKLRSALKLNLSGEDFYKEWSYFRPKCCFSKHWGNPLSKNVADYINHCIALSVENPSFLYPCFFTKYSGLSFPLSPFYRKRFLTIEDKLSFFYRGQEFLSSQNPYDFVQKEMLLDSKFQDISEILDSLSSSYNYLDID